MCRARSAATERERVKWRERAVRWVGDGNEDGDVNANVVHCRCPCQPPKTTPTHFTGLAVAASAGGAAASAAAAAVNDNVIMETTSLLLRR